MTLTHHRRWRKFPVRRARNDRLCTAVDLRKAWVFELVLGFSRKMFARMVFDQTVPTWLRLHVEAFGYLGGVPRVIVPDNLKAAVVRASLSADRDAHSIQRSYRELARHYGFVVDPTPHRSPQKQGKVESGVKYLKNFVRGSVFADAPEAQNRLGHWLQSVCNEHIYGTTGRRPEELFVEAEQAALLPLPPTPCWNWRAHPAPQKAPPLRNSRYPRPAPGHRRRTVPFRIPVSPAVR